MPNHQPLYNILREAFEAGERIAFHPDGPTAGSELAALAARMEKLVGWQPIETAPKDAEILMTDGAIVTIGWWENEIDDEESGRFLPGEWIAMAATNQPTHWMSLPSSPERET